MKRILLGLAALALISGQGCPSGDYFPLAPYSSDGYWYESSSDSADDGGISDGPADVIGGDICAENGWYGDGICDSGCPQPDPDCYVGTSDWCADNGYYGDGICDDCPQPDPDCYGGSGD